MNNVSIVGRITKDPERRVSVNGTTLSQFQLAVYRGMKNSNGDPITDFVPCVVWAYNAEYLCKYVRKGDMLAARGKITTRTSQNKEGNSIFIVEVLCEELQILNPRPIERPKEPVREEKGKDDDLEEGLPFL